MIALVEVRKNMEVFAPGDYGVFEETGRLFREFATKESCGKCVPCREGSKRMLEIFDRIGTEAERPEDLELLEVLADTVIATALCGLGKNACRMVMDALEHFRGVQTEQRRHVTEAVELDKPHPVIHADRCRGCGKCRRGCPMEAIEGAVRQAHVIDAAKCVNCGACVSNCPFDAIGPVTEVLGPRKGVMYVDGLRVPFDGEANILAVIRKAGIDMPTFCYHSELSVYGACRMCVVEDENHNIEAACAIRPKDGLRIRTNTARLLRSRRMILELMLAAHCRDCTTCIKTGNCLLQRLAGRFGVRNIRFQDTRPPLPRDESSLSIAYDPNRCILCGDCIRICDEVQGMNIWRFVDKGSEIRVAPVGDGLIGDTKCVDCGQCAAVCPTGSIVIKSQIGDAWRAIHDPNCRVVVQIAPAVRVAMGELFGLEPGENVIHKLVAALKIMGADLVFDTGFGADLTVMEEAGELRERLEKGGPLPLFTSCCPSWVKYVENSAPEFLENLSTCKSPMGMLASVIREYYAREDRAEGKRTVQIAIMPCTAKKTEAARAEFRREGRQDVELVLTTMELFVMIKESGIQFGEILGMAPDMPFGRSSGASVIFGSTGGVAEAVGRQLLEIEDVNGLETVEFSGVRGRKGVREAVIPYGGKVLRLAVVHGLGNVKGLLKDLKDGKVHYDLVEVMTCATGCVGGGGQPPTLTAEKLRRAAGLYGTDRLAFMKRSGHNPVMMQMYDRVLPGRSHELLHVDYTKKKH